MATLVAGTLLIFAACGREPNETHQSDKDKELEALRALPYVQWSEGADAKLRGVVVHDRDRAWRGANLYTNDRDEVYLMDMEGRRLHTWRLPATEHGHCEHAEILSEDRLGVLCVNDALYILDRRSNVVVEHRDKVHHDLAPSPMGASSSPTSRSTSTARGWSTSTSSRGSTLAAR